MDHQPNTPARPALDKRDWIAGLEKGLSVIECFDDANPRLTASQAGLRCGITRTAARRYLLTLEHMGYVASDGKLFWLTPRVLRLGQWSQRGYHASCSPSCSGSPPVRMKALT